MANMAAGIIIMFLQTDLIVFIICLLHIQLCDFKPNLGRYSTDVRLQWSSVNYVPIIDTVINIDVVMRNSTSKSIEDCALKCFLTHFSASIFYKSENQVCHCNDRKLLGVTPSVGSGSMYAENVTFYQTLPTNYDSPVLKGARIQYLDRPQAAIFRLNTAIFSDGFKVALSHYPFNRDCKDLHDGGIITNGVYRISPDGGDPFEVYCDMDGGGWTVFQRREDGSVDFYLGWDSYKEGFGELIGEHWLGLDSLYRLVQDPSELYIELATFDSYSGQRAGYANYSSFHIDDEANLYRLTVSGFTGDAGDSLSYGSGQYFTTKDNDNDQYAENCAEVYKGAWWYHGCHASNLNGLYLAGPTTTFADGVVWGTGWTQYYSLKKTVMKTRRK